MSASRSFLLLSFILLSLTLNACSATDGMTVECRAFEENPDQRVQVTLTSGDEFTVALCSMRNYGYRWSESLQIDNPEVVEELSRRYERGKSPMGGIPGKEIWNFRAREPGLSVITMEHTQLSGLNTRGTWTYQLTVTVEPATP